MAPALRAHIDSLITARRFGSSGRDDVLGRCLAAQAGLLPGRDPVDAGYSDTQIRSALIGFLVGGLPQPPMVGPQALEQLLRRPDALAGAQDAARRDDDDALAGHIFEALRFDPLAPALPRITLRDHTIAAGTSRAVTIPAGATVYVSFASAMRDPRRIGDAEAFNPWRSAADFMHFGLGLHQCFGLHINLALIPQMLKPLLRRQGLQRAPGSRGHLSKRGAFADQLTVTFKP
jgi:cytochrome P450